ncbi:thiocillin family RiPP [Paracoccus onubensis]|uniref:thiocillin family RiPP n=1 Tax=Paracoccus onubensis TaxID=1675788 RepID=UPI00272F84E3|nr:thiocillin family RiPP [Paracoccus onubensis]MDP0930012.1 thiocillin family RiPP [Paracoccus onubensis]
MDIKTSALDTHVFDLHADNELDLFAEELPEQVQLVSDCLSSASSASCCTCTGSFGSVGSVVSCG